MSVNKIGLGKAVVVLVLILSGCASAPPAQTSTRNGYTWSRGKLVFSAPHTLQKCHDATIFAFINLDVSVEGDSTTRDGGRIVGKTGAGESVTVDLVPESINLTKLRVRVGVMGNEGQSRLIADNIRRNL